MTARPSLPPSVDARVRYAEPRDVERMVALVQELAAYERAADEARITPEQLHSALFGDAPALHAFVAEVDGPDGPDSPDVVGFAVWFLNFSTWRGVHGIYLEDLFVRPEHRGSGLGRALLQALAAVAVERGYARVEWSVLDWNTPSIGFYRSLGAVPMDGWTTMRLTDDALRAFGGG